MNAAAKTPLVGIVMGSRSDWPTLQKAADILTELGVPFESKVVSAHRTPDLLYQYAADAAARFRCGLGVAAVTYGAGGSSRLACRARAPGGEPCSAWPTCRRRSRG